MSINFVYFIVTLLNCCCASLSTENQIKYDSFTVESALQILILDILLFETTIKSFKLHLHMICIRINTTSIIQLSYWKSLHNYLNWILGTKTKQPLLCGLLLIRDKFTRFALP